MKRSSGRWGIALGLALCLAALGGAVALQSVGYLAYLDSDLASELLLARRQAQTGSLVQMDWLYSTEIHILSQNLLYALAFLFDAGFKAARIIGNTLGMALTMGACVLLLRCMQVPWGGALAASALLGVTLGPTYGFTMTVGGVYLSHGVFCYGCVALWLLAAQSGRTRRARLLLAAGFAALCGVMGFLSVRYVLCFLCPMMAVAVMDALLAPQMGHTLRDERMRFSAVTAAGFAACLLGYAASEVIVPRLFHSGVGAASSFRFLPLDSGEIGATLGRIVEDSLELMGWRGGVPLFSAAGLCNLCIAGVLLLGGIMTVRVYRALTPQQQAQRRLMQAAFAALGVNLFCFLFIEGTYLPRYLIPAVLLLPPTMAVVVHRERSLRLKACFVLLLCALVGMGSVLTMSETRTRAEAADEASADLMDIGRQLIDAGYTHGYGTFWNVRVLEERTQGALTFTGVDIQETEEGAACPASLGMIRWLEPDSASHLDACPGKTFLLLTGEEAQRLSAWLELTGAPQVGQSGRYAAYGFDSSQALCTYMLLGSMKLENARALGGGVFEMEAGGRMRVPTTFREAGRYTLRFVCEGEPAADSAVQAYTGRTFALLAEQMLTAGENALEFTLAQDDKYFMLLLRAGGAQRLTIREITLDKAEE
ncbi:MAG: hypothetical protein ACI4PG_03040 [Candidatus Ventricola sp.]